MRTTNDNIQLWYIVFHVGKNITDCFSINVQYMIIQRTYCCFQRDIVRLGTVRLATEIFSSDNLFLKAFDPALVEACDCASAATLLLKKTTSINAKIKIYP